MDKRRTQHLACIGSTDPAVAVARELPREGAFDWELTHFKILEAYETRPAMHPFDLIVVEQGACGGEPVEALTRVREGAPTADLLLGIAPEAELGRLCDWVNRCHPLHVLPLPFAGKALREFLVDWARRREERRAAEGEGACGWYKAEIDRLEREATIDALTGLMRRDAWLKGAGAEFQRGRRTGQSAVVMMADIDLFKRVNDEFGHPAGDRTLQRVAMLLKENCRPYDLVGRYGGEEFVILCPGILLEEGRRVGERLRGRVEGFAWETEKLPAVTISVGVAELRAGEADELGQSINAADEALYAAKRSGRNRVCVAGEKRIEN